MEEVPLEDSEAPESQKEAGGDSISPDIRRSQRTRSLTEKGKQLQEAKLADLRKTFERMYKRWKYHINGLKRAIKHREDSEFVSEIFTAVNGHQVELNNTYERIRVISVPDQELRRKIDSCSAITKAAREKAQCFITAAGDPDEIPWPEADSVFDPTDSSIVSRQSLTTSKVSSRASVKSAQRKQQAAAEVAATEQVLKIMKFQHQCEEEIRALEAEEKKMTAERDAQDRAMEAEKARQNALFVAESAARKRKMEEKRKEVERLEELKRHNAAQARLQVYAEEVLPDSPNSSPQHIQSSHATISTRLDAAAHPFVPLPVPLSIPSFPITISHSSSTWPQYCGRSTMQRG